MWEHFDNLINIFFYFNAFTNCARSIRVSFCEGKCDSHGVPVYGNIFRTHLIVTTLSVPLLSDSYLDAIRSINRMYARIVNLKVSAPLVSTSSPSASSLCSHPAPPQLNITWLFFLTTTERHAKTRTCTAKSSTLDVWCMVIITQSMRSCWCIGQNFITFWCKCLRQRNTGGLFWDAAALQPHNVFQNFHAFALSHHYKTEFGNRNTSRGTEQRLLRYDHRARNRNRHRSHQWDGRKQRVQ